MIRRRQRLGSLRAQYNMFVWEAANVVIMLLQFGGGGRDIGVEGHQGGRRRENDQMWAQGLDLCAQGGGDTRQTEWEAAWVWTGRRKLVCLPNEDEFLLQMEKKLHLACWFYINFSWKEVVDLKFTYLWFINWRLNADCRRLDKNFGCAFI